MLVKRRFIHLFNARKLKKKCKIRKKSLTHIGFYSYMNSTYKRGIKENMEVQKQIKNELIQREK